MPKMHLKQPGFTYIIEKLTKTRNTNDLDKDQKWSW